MSPRIRIILATAATGLPLTAIFFSGVALRTQLPDTLPTQWSGSEAGSETPTWLIFYWTLAVALAGLFVSVYAAPATEGYRRRKTLMLGGTISGLALSVWAICVIGSIDGAFVPDGRALLLVATCWIWGLFPMLVSPRNTATAETKREENHFVSSPWVELTEQERARLSLVWTKTQAIPLFIVLGAVALVSAGVPLGVSIITSWSGPLDLIPALPLLLVIAIMAAFAGIRVTADRRGVRVTSVLFGISLASIPLSDISRSRVVRVTPAEWGGWGYRVSPAGSGIILFAGEALMLERHSTVPFFISTRQPSIACEALDTLTSRMDEAP